MDPVITTFSVDNGDMTLFQLQSGRTLLVDINIRQPKKGVRDVAADLRDRLKKDGEGRHYVDAMLLTHPDQDHCRGLAKHFHLGPPDDYAEPEEGEVGKIIIREMWSSPMIFRRRSKDHSLCDDASAWCEEARRRAKLFKSSGFAVVGDMIQIMGEDEPGKDGRSKTDGLEAILVKAGSTIDKICRQYDGTMKGFLIAPKGLGDAAEEERRSKNHSSVIIRFSIANGSFLEATRYLAGGDALVGIWEQIWKDYKDRRAVLEYDILGAPHHCSWRSLSYESWSKSKGEAGVCEEARNALGQARSGAFIVASSKLIVNDEDDPPCIGAKREYVAILKDVRGTFLNTADHANDTGPTPMEFVVRTTGPELQDPGSNAGPDLVKQAARNAFSSSALKNDKSRTVLPAQARSFA